MNISNEGINLIKNFEGCVLKVYLDAVNVPTSGYGHTSGLTLADVGKPITQAQADSDLKSDLVKFESKVNKYNDIYKWTQNEFDAMVSFAFNIGSIDQLTANGTRTKSQIADAIPLYNKAGGKVLNGLTKRRKAEQELFLKDSTNKLSGICAFLIGRDGEIKIADHFKVKEFACKDGSPYIYVDVDFVRDYLEKIRMHFNAPVTVNSAYRTVSYNLKIGGANNSYHMKGQAFDIVVKGYTPSEVAKYAQSIGIKGIIQYNTFVHLDSRTTVYHAINDNGKITKVTSF